MHMDLISIIIPVYNVEKYLRQCLDSVVSQTCKNIEVIMVDDGSPDGCGAICDEYAEKYPNFIAVHKANAGLGMARNTGLENVHGKYVTFVDSDDWIEPDLIEKLYDGVISNKVDFCKSGFHRVNSKGKIVAFNGYKDDVYKGKLAKEKLLPRMVGSSPSQHDSVEMCVWGALYKIEIIRKNHLEFSSERELIAEDIIFNIDYLQHADGGCVISYVGYNYRMNDISLTKRYRSDRFESVVRLYDYERKMLEELGYGIETVYRLDRMFFVNIRGCIISECKTIAVNGKEVAKQNIKAMCCNTRLQEIIAEYPVNKLGIKQKIFIYMVKYKIVTLLYFCVRAGLLT